MAAIARRRWLVASAVAGALLAVALAAIVVWQIRKDNDIPSRDSALGDLLAWIPADDAAAASFAAWTPDPGRSSELTALDALPTYTKLGVDPLPAALGTDLDWPDRYGWSAGDVTGWAAAGDGELGVLSGDFPFDEIAGRLAAAGYHQASYRGLRLFVAANDATPADPSANGVIPGVGAIALFRGRIVTARSSAQLHRAIDVAKAGSGSLADNDAVSQALAKISSLSLLTGTTQSLLAAACDVDAVAGSTGAAGRTNYALVGYGRTGKGGARRTVVAVSYPSADAAAANLAAVRDGWNGGFVNARGAGASISTYGEVSGVSQSGRLLVAELVNGRDDDWVRTGIRYALPVCEAAMALAPAATPDLTGGAGRLATMERLSNGLPSTGDPAERFRAVDLDLAAAARGATVPGPGADEAAVRTWLGALQPLPAMEILPNDAGQLAAWSSMFGIALSAVDGVAEFNGDPGATTVGIVIGSWDEAGLTARLIGLGYQTIVIDSVRQFAIDRSLSSNDPFLTAHPIWTNIAVLGDRMWISASQATMRAVLAQATDPTVESVQSSTALRPRLATAVAIQSDGAAAVSASCGSVLAGTTGFAVVLERAGGGTAVHVIAMLDGTRATSEIKSQLDDRISSLTVVPPAAGKPERLTAAFDYRGVSAGGEASTPSVDAELAISPKQLANAGELWTLLLGGCRLTGAT
jgi:hypothetical protein